MSTDKEREKVRERVRRYREKHRAAGVTASNVTPVTPNKAVCRCTYFKQCNGQLICIQCGRTAPVRKGEDKLSRGIHIK